MASSVIGLLRVILSANSAEYDTVMRKAAVTAAVTSKEIEATTSSSKGLMGAFGGLGGAATTLAASFGAIAAVGLVKSFVDSASAVNDMSERLGVSTDAVQRWKFAAEQTGSTIDDFATAMGQLQKKVTEGSDSTADALGRIGLTIEQVRGLDPVTLFETTAEAIKNVKDPTERAAVAMELFGRGGTKILPALVEGVKELGDQAERTHQIISGETVKSVDGLGDSFSALLGTGKNLIGGILAPLAPMLSTIASAATAVIGPIAELGQKLGELASGGKQMEVSAWASVFETIGLKAEEALPKVAALEQQAKLTMAGMAANAKAPDDALKNLDETYKELDDRQKEANKTSDKATEAWKKQQEQIEKARQAEEDLKVKVIELTAALEDQYNQQQLAIAQWSEFDRVVSLIPFAEVGTKVEGYSVEAEIAATKTDMLSQAFKTLGITSRAELQKIADNAKAAYEEISRQLGKISPEAIEAFKKWQEAAKNAAGETKTSWSDVFPHIVNIVKNIQTAVEGSFAQMMLGAKGFHDGFLDIWKSLKAGIAQILTEILGDFVNRFLKGILAALMGAQGGFGKAFQGLLGGGLSSLIPGLGGLGGAAPGLVGIGGTVPALPGAATAGGGLLAGIGGGLGAGAAGIGLGFLFKNLFGGAGAGAGLAGGASGAATGALIGSIVPGLGTLVGALIGGLTGLVSGWFGKSAGMKANVSRDQFLTQFDTQGQAGTGFMNLAAKLTEVTGEAGGGSLFKMLQDANTTDKVQKAIEAITAALNAYEQKQKDATAATDANTAATAANKAEQEKRIESFKAQMADLDSQLQNLNASEAPEAHMGVIERQTRERIAQQKQVLQNALDEAQKAANESLDQTGNASDDTVRTITDGFKMGFVKIGEGFDGVATDAESLRTKLDTLFGNLHYNVTFDQSEMPKVPGFASGTPNLGFMNFGTGRLAMLHGREAVVREDQAAAFAAKQGSSDSGAVTLVVLQSTGNVDGDLDAILRVVPSLTKNKRGAKTKLREALEIR